MDTMWENVAVAIFQVISRENLRTVGVRPRFEPGSYHILDSLPFIQLARCLGTGITTVHTNTPYLAVPWLRRLVAGLSPRRPGFDPGSVHVGFMVDKVALGQVFPPSVSFHRCSSTWKKERTNHHQMVAQ
jgi:hypothetical protein